LQELTAFPINDVPAAGYGAIWHGQTSWSGVAILAKGTDPLESRRDFFLATNATCTAAISKGLAHSVIVG
jgi:exodeoxyribonuclease III